MSNIIDLSKLPISDGKQVINIIGLNDNGNIIRAENDAYSKAEVDEKLANVKVDLTGYATEQWVKKQDYATNSDVDEEVSDKVGQVNQRFYDYYTKSQVDEKVANVTVDLTGYATEEYVNDAIANIDIPEGGGSTEGGDSGVYIIEDTVEIRYRKFTCLEGQTWKPLEYEYNYMESYEGSERQTKNLETITAIKEGKCKAVVFKRYMGVENELVSSENGIETYVSKGRYSYFPCQFYINPNSWQWGGVDVLEIQYFDMGDTTSSQDETTNSKVFSTDTASLIAERAFSLLPPIQHTVQVSDYDDYKLYGWDFPSFRDSNTIMRIMMYKANWETGEETYEFYPASHSYNNHTNEVSVWIITKYGEIMMWNKPADVPDDTEIFPTVTSIGGGSGDSYTKEEIDSMVGDINKILTSI